MNLQNTVQYNLNTKKENMTYPLSVAHAKERQVQAQPPVELLNWGCGSKSGRRRKTGKRKTSTHADILPHLHASEGVDVKDP